MNRLILATALLAGPTVAVASQAPDALAAHQPSATPAVARHTPAVTASNAFGIDLYRTLSKAGPRNNLFISPYSMSVALTMTAEGARQETEAEMARVLHFPAASQSGVRPVAKVHEGYLALSQRFAAAAGKADPQVRQRVDTLRAQLNASNTEAQKLQREGKWKEAMDTGSKAERLAGELNALLPQFDRFDLRVANALWVERTFSLVPSYVQTIDRFYGTGGVTPLDIAGDTEASRARINAWVEDNTEKRIKDLLPAGSLAADTRLVITNAVYFRGQWAEPFTDASTRDEHFTLTGGDKVKVEMMNDQSRKGVPYAAFNADGTFFATPREVPRDESKAPATYPADDGFSMIELPYKGGELSMVVIAPRQHAGLEALEGRLSADVLASWLNKLESRTVHTALPRFKMESEHEMSEALQSMGMRRAFASPGQPGGAQFTGMSSSEDPAQQLFIGRVRHKAWVEVTEKGTEAAAATAVMMAPGSAARPPETVPFTPTFRADRPFIFLIRDTQSGAILFIGRQTHPVG